MQTGCRRKVKIRQTDSLHSKERLMRTYVHVHCTGSGTPWTARTAEIVSCWWTGFCLVEVHLLVRKVHHRHISQYLKFQKLLEFISCQLAVSPMIFSELLTHMKTICLFGFSGIVATYLTWSGKLFMRLEARSIRILCVKNYDDHFKLL